MPNSPVIDLDSLFGGGGGGGGSVVDLDSLDMGSSPAPITPPHHSLGRGLSIAPHAPSMTERLKQLASDIWSTPGRMVDSAANYYSGIPTPLPSANDQEYQGSYLHAPNDIPAAELAAEAMVPEEEARKSYIQAAHRAALDLVLPFGTDPMNAAVGIGLQGLPTAASRAVSGGFAAHGAVGASQQAKLAQKEIEQRGMSPEALREVLSAAGSAVLSGVAARHAVGAGRTNTHMDSEFMSALNDSLKQPRDMAPRLAPKQVQGPQVPSDFYVDLDKMGLGSDMAQPGVAITPGAAEASGQDLSRVEPIQVQDQIGGARPGTQSMAEKLRMVDAERAAQKLDQQDQTRADIITEGQKMGQAGGQRELEAMQKREFESYQEAQKKADLEANIPSFMKGKPPVAPVSEMVQPQSAPQQVERRSSDRLSGTSTVDILNRLSDMTPDELREAVKVLHTQAYTDNLTGLPNKAAFVARELAPENVGKHRVTWDAEGLKFGNDTWGHGVGDQLLKLFGDTFRSLGIDAARTGGDEFYSFADNPEQGNAHIQAMNDVLKNATIDIVTPDGQNSRIRGFRLWGGGGPDAATAEADLIRVKEQAVQSGLRAPRGERPLSLREEPIGPVRGEVAPGDQGPHIQPDYRGGVRGGGPGVGFPGPEPGSAPDPRAQSVELDPNAPTAGAPGGPGPQLPQPGPGPDLAGISNSIGTDPTPGAYPGAFRRAVSPQEDVLRQIPGVGEQLYSHIQKYRTRADTLAGQSKAIVDRATRGLTPEDWSQLIAAMNTGQYEGTSSQVQAAAQAIRSQVLEPLWAQAASAGATEVQPKENFFPSMTRRGGQPTPPRPEPGFGQSRMSGSSVASLEHSRVTPVEDLIQTKQVLDRYINDVSHRVAEAEVMGPDMERVGGLIQNLPPDQKAYAQKAFMRATGNDFVDETGRMLGKVRRAKAIVALPFAGVTQYGQVVPTIASGGMGNTLKALNAMRKNFPETQARAYETGSLSPTLSGETLSTNTGTSAGLYGIGTADMHMRVLANETGLQMAAQKGLTGQAAQDFAREFANQTQYRTEAEKLPQWATSPLGKTVTQFMPFGYRHAIYLQDLVQHGERARVMRYLALAPVVGYAVAAAKAGLKGYDPEDVTVLDALRASGGGGAFEDLLNRVTSHDPALSLAGPVAENAHDLVDAAASGSPLKASAAAAASFVPGFGGQISREILAGNDESKLPTRPGWVARLRDFAQDRPSNTRVTLRALEEERKALQAAQGQLSTRYPKAPSSGTLTPEEKLGHTRNQVRRVQIVNEVLDQLARGDVPAARRLLAKAHRDGFTNLTLKNITAGRQETEESNQ